MNANRRKELTMTFGYGKLKTTRKTPGGAAETVENLGIKSSCKAEDPPPPCTKNELNLLVKNPIGKYDVIITYETQLHQT